MITAIIPVRKGSQRVKNKNIKPFGGSSLLEIKIKILSKLKNIEKTLGPDLKRLQHFFDNNNGYNDQMIIDWYKDHFNEKLDKHCIKELLVDYADYQLGKRIQNCIEKIGQCNINCEL